MMRIPWPVVPLAACCVAMTPMLPHGIVGAQVRTLDIGGPPGDTTSRACLTDSMITAVLAAFNNPAAVRVYGGNQTIPSGVVFNTSYHVFQGQLLLAGTVQGNVLVLNGDARVTRTGVVTGTITVIGGRLIPDPGASLGGLFNCTAQPALAKTVDGTVIRRAPGRSIGSVASALTWNLGHWQLTPHVGSGPYNRAEGLPLQFGANARRTFGATDTLRAQLFGIGRTAGDPSGSRPGVGWQVTGKYSHGGSLPYTVAVEGGETVDATRDRPWPALESGLSSILFRTDYRDWMRRRGASATVSVQPWREVTLAAAFDVSHQTTVLATDAFSLFRNTSPWRANPLIDDGTYRTLAARIIWDARDPAFYPVLSWYVRAELRRTSSSSLTPVTLPTTIRDALPAGGYAASEGEVDVRASLRIDPEQRLNFRASGGGYLGGDPLTIQRRRAMGGADPIIGYDFRGINCDRRRKADPAIPALCDRSAAIQVEYHRTLALDLTTRINGNTVGIRKPDLVFLADAGSAWLAGDSAGRVPTGRIQSLGEWRSDVGVGITSGPFGLYLAKALTDAIPIRLTFLFKSRF